MKFILFFAIVIGGAVAEQFVALNQDTRGNYNLQYTIGGISRAEARNAFGEVSGAYSFIDPHGIVRKTHFTAGANGYNAIGTDIPLPVQDTPEVAHAKATHLAALHTARLSLPVAPLEVQHPELFRRPIALAAPTHFALPTHLAVAAPAPIALPAPAPLALPALAPHPLTLPIAHHHTATIAAPLIHHAAPIPAPFIHHTAAIPTYHHFGGIGYTPEVAAARAQHFAAHAAALRSHGYHH